MLKKPTMQRAQTGRNPRKWTSDPTEFAAEPFELAEAGAGGAARNSAPLTAAASLVRLDQGLYAIEIGETTAPDGEISGLMLPVIQISAAPGDRDEPVEIVGTSASGVSWLAQDGGTVVVRSPPGGGHLLVAIYGPPDRVSDLPCVEVRRLDRSRPHDAAPGSLSLGRECREIQTEIVLHIERLGDRRFQSSGWIGNPDQKLRIEAFSIRPLEILTARDIEFKAVGPNGRETPWFTEAELCGTRGRSLPLTGFAVRLAPRVSDEFEVVYRGAFFDSGIVGPKRNGEICIPPIHDDPLKAIEVHLARRAR
jgi:hypothetical protein